MRAAALAPVALAAGKASLVAFKRHTRVTVSAAGYTGASFTRP